MQFYLSELEPDARCAMVAPMIDAVIRPSEMGASWAVGPGYLNTALRGVPPKASVDAASALVAAWANGSLDWIAWLDEIAAVRQAFARLIAVGTDEIAIGHGGASLMAAAARVLPPGSTVITLAQEHNSCTIPFLHAGAGLVVESVLHARLEERLAQGGYAALAISLVQSFDGRIVDLAALRLLVKAAGAWLLVDATQALGWLPFDIRLTDLCVASCYKWLMGPNGPSFGWASPELLPRLKPAAPNWFACVEPYAAPYGADFQLADTTRRLDVVPGLLSLAALRPSLELLAAIGIERVRAHDVALAAKVRRGLGIQENGSALVSFERPGAGEALAQAGLQVTARGDRVRMAFHIHNTRADAERILEVLG